MAAVAAEHGRWLPVCGIRLAAGLHEGLGVQERGQVGRVAGMAELKTQKNEGDVEAFLDAIADKTQRDDSHAVRRLMAEITGDEGSMWGPSIVGFGSHRYRYASGKVNEWFQVGFSPRKKNLTLYIMDGFDEYGALLGRLGKHSTGKSCLYVKRLADVDTEVLRDLIAESVQHLESTSLDD